MKNRSFSTVKNIAQQLQGRLHRSEWAQTGKLPGQRQLADDLGVSRASLREAITMLEALGLLRSEPGRGVFIVAQEKNGPANTPRRRPFVDFRSATLPTAQPHVLRLVLTGARSRA